MTLELATALENALTDIAIAPLVAHVGAYKARRDREATLAWADAEAARNRDADRAERAARGE